MTNIKNVKFDAQNEQVIIATMIRNKNELKKLSKVLVEDDFVADRHKIIFSVLKIIANKNLTWNEDTFMSIAGNKNYGGYKYINQLTNNYDPNINIDYHISKLKSDKFKIDLIENFIPRLIEKTEDPDGIVKEISSVVEEIRSASRNANSDIRVKKSSIISKEYVNSLDSRITTGGNFRPTYFSWLDENLVEGYAPKKVSLWSARPGMGKTTFLVNQVLRFVVNDVPALILPLETGVESFIDSYIACYCQIERDLLIKNPGKLTKENLKNINEALERLSKSKVDFNDDRSTTLEDLGAILHSNNYSVCKIDLFEKLRGVSGDQKYLSDALEYIQVLAQETNTHIGLYHQFNRGVENSKSKRPSLSSLKNSGKYEEVADLVIGLYREKYYDSTLTDDIFELIILKQRVGEAGISTFYEFDGKHATIGKERADKNKSWVCDLDE